MNLLSGLSHYLTLVGLFVWNMGAWIYKNWRRQSPYYVEPSVDKNPTVVDKNPTVVEMDFSTPSEVRCNVYLYKRHLSDTAVKILNSTQSSRSFDQTSVSHWAIVVQYFWEHGSDFAIYESGRYSAYNDHNIARWAESVTLELLQDLNFEKEMCVAENCWISPVEAAQFCEEFTREKKKYDAYTENCQRFGTQFIQKFVPELPEEEVPSFLPYDAEAVNSIGKASKLGSSVVGGSVSVSLLI